MNAKVFKIDDSEFIASKLDIEKTREWYENEFGVSVENIKEVSGEEGMWVYANDDDIQKLGNNDEIITKEKIGSIKKICGDIWKNISMNEQMNVNGEFHTAYVLASIDF